MDRSLLQPNAVRLAFLLLLGCSQWPEKNIVREGKEPLLVKDWTGKTHVFSAPQSLDELQQALYDRLGLSSGQQQLWRGNRKLKAGSGWAPSGDVLELSMRLPGGGPPEEEGPDYVRMSTMQTRQVVEMNPQPRVWEHVLPGLNFQGICPRTAAQCPAGQQKVWSNHGFFPRSGGGLLAKAPLYLIGMAKEIACPSCGSILEQVYGCGFYNCIYRWNGRSVLKKNGQRMAESWGSALVTIDTPNVFHQYGAAGEALATLLWDMLAFTVAPLPRDEQRFARANRPELWWAVQHNQAGTVKVLLGQPQWGFDPCRRDARGWLPLHYAVGYGYAAVVEALLAHDSAAMQLQTLVPGLGSVFALAFQQGNLSVMRALAAAGADLAVPALPNQLTPLHLACLKVHYPLLKALLARDVSVDACTGGGVAALHIATKKGNLAMVEALLQAGAAVNIRSGKGNTPFPLAFAQRNRPLMTLLATYGANVNVGAVAPSPLQLAYKMGDLPLLKALLAQGALVDVPDDQGRTLLYLACQAGVGGAGNYWDNGVEHSGRVKPAAPLCDTTTPMIKA